MLIIQPIGGLCNRMRAINSAHMLAKRRNDTLHVVWFCSPELNCPFEQLFQVPKGLTIHNIYSKWNLKKLYLQFFSQFINNDMIKHNKTDGMLHIDFIDTLSKKCYIATEEHFYPCHTYDLFLPTPLLQSNIDHILQNFSSHTVGVHIRRTDNMPAIGKSTTAAFISAMQKELSKNPDTVFYLATDDSKEEESLRTLFPDKIISNEDRDLSRNSVQGIQDALLDLYALARTDKIIGSYFSSFTDIAADMRQIPKIIAGDI